MSAQADMDARDLNESIYLMKTDEDIEAVRTALIYYLEQLYKRREQPKSDLAANFVNVILMLKKTNKLMELFNDKVPFMF